jgi:hypothetical protein
VVRVEERTYLDPEGLVFVGRPDVAVRDARRVDRPPDARNPGGKAAAGHSVAVELPVPDQVRERWLEIRDVSSGEVVTVLEILSPSNKRTGRGRSMFEEKRMTVLSTRTPLVEIDLLRGGQPMPMRGSPSSGGYRILVSRSEKRPIAELFPFSLRDEIPAFRIPLRGGAEEPIVELRQVLDHVYDAAGYDLSIDYLGEPDPALTEVDAAWVDELLKRSGKRP